MKRIFSEFKQIENVIIYGTRARGNFNQNDTINLAIFGDNLNQEVISSIKQQLENQTEIEGYYETIHLNAVSKSIRPYIYREGTVVYDAVFDNVITVE